MFSSLAVSIYLLVISPGMPPQAQTLLYIRHGCEHYFFGRWSSSCPLVTIHLSLNIMCTVYCTFTLWIVKLNCSMQCICLVQVLQYDEQRNEAEGKFLRQRRSHYAFPHTEDRLWERLEFLTLLDPPSVNSWLQYNFQQQTWMIKRV